MQKWLLTFVSVAKCPLVRYPALGLSKQSFSRSVSPQVISLWHYRLVGRVVRRPPRERKVPGSDAACAGIFSKSSHTCDLNIGTPVATLPGAWCYRVCAGTGRPGVSILWLGEVDSWICNFYLSVAAGKIVWADPSLRYTRMMLERWATNQQTNHLASQQSIVRPK